MRHTLLHTSAAFTRNELIVVIVLVAVIGGLLVFMLAGPPISVSHAPRITYLNNLKQVGLAYRIWANDHHDRFPASEPARNGGWSEVLTNADQGFLAWTNYAIMNVELGGSSKLLVCPSDERSNRWDWNYDGKSWHDILKDNRGVSYFIGVSANSGQPQSLLAGDRNMAGGSTPELNFGYSPEGGQGNDVAIQTYLQARPVCWSLKMHSQGNLVGAGNILLGDGSAQEFTTLSFRTIWVF